MFSISPFLAHHCEKAPTGVLVGHKGTCRGTDASRKNKDMEGEKMLKCEKEKDQKGRSWHTLCVGLKSWHLLNGAAALGAKCCQPAPPA